MIRLLVNILVFVINVLYKDRPYPRFYVLETVARVPYFSYLSVLHLYETLGWWRGVDWLKVHFAESWNELHHLLIIEALGGGDNWRDRALGRSAALIYYWVVVVVYLLFPHSAYRFMELVEGHDACLSHLRYFFTRTRRDSQTTACTRNCCKVLPRWRSLYV